MKRINLKKILICLIICLSLFLFTNCDNDVYYRVTFDLDNGEEIIEKTIKSGQLIVTPSQPDKEDYDFVGWFDKVTLEKFDPAIPIDHDINLIARFELQKELAEKYDVSYYVQDKLLKTIGVYEDRCAPEITAPSMEGHNFIEWRYNDVAFNFNTQIKEAISLYAYYEPVKIKVTLIVNDETSEIDVDYGSKITGLTNPTKKDYDFIGWFKDNELFDFETEIKEEITLNGRFKKADGSSIDIEYDFGYDCFETKDDLRIAFLTDFYNFLLDKSYDFNRINIESIDDFLEYFNTWKVGNRSDLYHTGDSFANLYVTVDIDGKVEDQPVDTFIGYCYQNNKYRDFINHLIVFFEYWRTDEGYSQTDPHGNDFFAEPWASMVDTAKFFFFTSENLHDKYRWFNSDRVNYALDHIPGVGYVKLVYSDSEHDYVTLPEDVTRDGYEFLGWYDEAGNRVTKVYDDIKVYAKWEEKQN